MTSFFDTTEEIQANAPGGMLAGSRSEGGESQIGEIPPREHKALGWMDEILAGGPQYISCSGHDSDGYSLQNGKTTVRRGVDKSFRIPFPLSGGEQIVNEGWRPERNRFSEKLLCH